MPGGVLLAESVELATIWLVDLVGSTRLATSVGPVRADELREEFFGLLREAIAAAGGREFKNTGDGLFVAFSSASAAVSGAVLTQQLFERRYRRREQQLHVRIGLGTGESTIKDGDYFGMPSIEAARLCDKAPADGILVSPTTKLLAGRVDGARFESVGELELKGIPEPMEAFSVVWEPLDPTRLPARRAACGRCRRCCGRCRGSYTSGGSRSAGCLSARATRRGQVRGRSRCSRVSRGSGRPGWRRTPRWVRMRTGSGCVGAAVRRISRRRMSRGSRSAHRSSSTRQHDALAAYVERFGGEISRLARNLGQRVPGAPAPQFPIRRRSGSCCSRRSPSCSGRPAVRGRCVWCSTIFTGPTGSRSRC